MLVWSIGSRKVFFERSVALSIVLALLTSESGHTIHKHKGESSPLHLDNIVFEWFVYGVQYVFYLSWCYGCIFVCCCIVFEWFVYGVHYVFYLRWCHGCIFVCCCLYRIKNGMLVWQNLVDCWVGTPPPILDDDDCFRYQVKETVLFYDQQRINS